MASGSETLVNILNTNERIQIFSTNLIYEHINDLEALTSLGHKLNNAAAIYGDHLLFNTSFANKTLYPCAKFIFCVRPGAATVNELIKTHYYTPETALNYYCFRLRRIYEMAYQIPKSIVIDWNDLVAGNWMPEIEKYLQLKEPLQNSKLIINQTEDVAPLSIRHDAENYYERYFYLFKELKIKDSPQKF